jgi:hypothetical protein
MSSAAWFLMIIGLLSCKEGNNDRNFMAMDAFTGDVPSPVAGDAGRTISTPVEERKVIKRGEIRFQTKSIQETTAFVTDIVMQLNGYISGDNVYNSDDRVTQRVEIRVPADSFDELLSGISESAKKIDSKNVYTQDVTEEYIDIETRLRTKKELENRYMELLKQAKTVEDMLAIEKELGTLRSDIESIEGRLKYLSNQVSLATLSVEYYEMTSSTLNFSSKLGQAVVMGWRLLLGFLIGLVNLWPFILIAGIIIVISLRIRRTRQKNQLK